MQNDYYWIAINDLQYVQSTYSGIFYNNIVINTQQVAEKMLKSVVEAICPYNDTTERLMKSHNLRALYDLIKQEEQNFFVDRDKLSTLKDYYFDAKYPGDNFVTVTRQECEACIATMNQVIAQVDQFRVRHGLPTAKWEAKELTTEFAEEEEYEL